MTTEELVRVEHAGHVSILTLNRPDKLNALDADVLTQLARAIEALAARAETRCAIVTGEGKAFVAGADIASMKDLSVAEARAFADKGQATFAALEALPFPVIAAVNGFALGGGCELALACDFIYVSAKAKLGQPEVKLGVIPGFGGTQRLMRRVGIARARELIYTGDMIGAEEAVRIGLANRACAPEELMDTARQTAEKIAKMGPLAVAAAKRVMRDGADRPLGEANGLEAGAFAGCFAHADQTEGMEAFLAKREADFQGK